jgi:hypothetical protein
MKVRIRWIGVLLANLGLLVLPGVSQSGCSRHVAGVVWLHSFEQDHDGMLFFRPRSFAFPPSRGPRDGILLRRDGNFVRYGIGAGDAGSSKTGRWGWVGTGVFELVYSRPTGRTAFQIVSCARDELVLRPIQNSGANGGGD